MGRKPIVMEKIKEPRKREMTFSKRKFGVMKKACELSVLCGCDVALLVLKDDKVYQCGSLPVDEVLAKYVKHKVIEENKTSKDIMEAGSKSGQSGEEDDNGEEMRKNQTEQQKEEYQEIDRQFKETLEQLQLQGLAQEQHSDEQLSAGSEELKNPTSVPSLDTSSFSFSPISLDPAIDLMGDLPETSPRPSTTSPIPVPASQRMMSTDSAGDSSIGSVTSFVSSMASPGMVSSPELASPGPSMNLNYNDNADICLDSSVFDFADLSFPETPEKRPFDDEMMCGSPPKRQRSSLEWQGYPSMGTTCEAIQDMTSYGQNGVMSPPNQQQMFTPQQDPSEDMPLPMLCRLAYSLLGRVQKELLGKGRKEQQLLFQGAVPAMSTAEIDQLQLL